MCDLEFINTISSTFSSEIDKFIHSYTLTIKQQFETVDTKLKEQEQELNKLKDELKNKKFDETNYTSVSVIKNQDKQIYELNNTIKNLENRIKYLELKNNVKSEPTYETVENNNTELIKNISKRVSKKKDEITSTESIEISETNSEKPQKKIAIKKGSKINTKLEIVSEEQSIKEAQAEKQQRLKEEADEQQRLKEEAKKTLKKENVKEKEKKSKKSQKTTKEEVKEEVKEEKTELKVSFPNTIPKLMDVNILEVNDIEYYIDDTNNNMFLITNDEDIGAFVGVYDKDKKIIIMKD